MVLIRILWSGIMRMLERSQVKETKYINIMNLSPFHLIIFFYLQLHFKNGRMFIVFLTL